METFLEERIGDPRLFTGRHQEMARYLKWIDDIKMRKSKSAAILARRKMGKTAFLERLFNLTFAKGKDHPAPGSVVIPFYYEVREGRVWMMDFAHDFMLRFISQYLAFHTQNPVYLLKTIRSMEQCKALVAKEGYDFFVPFIEDFQRIEAKNSADLAWDIARELPHTIAAMRGEFIVQMIDEFQFLTSEIYRDQATTHVADDMAGGYLSTAESKIAPLLVTGSWVTWLMKTLDSLLPSRFKKNSTFRELSEEEALAMIYRYSEHFEVSVTEEIAHSIFQVSQGDPHYISAIIRSEIPDKNLKTTEGFTKVLDYETLDPDGDIAGSWMEYIGAAFQKTNGALSKSIVLYLCQHRGQEVKRKDLLQALALDLTEEELEIRLKALTHADIIRQGQTNARYCAVNDNLFDKVFRGVFHEDIADFSPEQIHGEHLALSKQAVKDYRRQLGKLNYEKGLYAEFLIIRCFAYRVEKESQHFLGLIHNLPEDFQFVRYHSVWSYTASPEHGRDLQVDLLARAEDEHYSVIGEVKNRSGKKFSLAEAKAFLHKFEQVRQEEQIGKALPFVFSRRGFYKNTEAFMKHHQIAYTESIKWLD